jgi:hypothetical protein
VSKGEKMLTGLITSGTQRVRKTNHAHIFVKADAGWTDQQISEALNVSVPTIERIRLDYIDHACLNRQKSATENRPLCS